MNSMKRSSAPSMIDEASVRVASGLRPKQRTAITSNNRIGAGQSQPQLPKGNQVHFCANPLDRMCELLLDWQILANIEGGRGLKENSSLPRESLPTFFASHRSYIEHWEPLLVEEVKACILSNLPLNTKGRSKCGTAMVSSQGGGNTNLSLMNLNCSFTGNKADSNTSTNKDTECSAR